MNSSAANDKLLGLLAGDKTPDAEEFKQLIIKIDNHRILAKVFLLEGTPHVFKTSPMKYVIFREQVADRFDVGSQDICIVGSAKLGYTPSPHKYGTLFSQKSDVDVVIISEPLFYRGSKELFLVLNQLTPTVSEIRSHLNNQNGNPSAKPVVGLDEWNDVKQAIRNFVYENFNPGLLPDNHHLRKEIFEKIGSTAGLFLALEPQVFVSKIRARIFRTWKAAEDYYANSLREAKLSFTHSGKLIETDDDDSDELIGSENPDVTKQAHQTV